ncbi:leucine rich adaptor protein 1-like isoform X1 [Alosa sapidissima]|uniref:leucine rich adaptor protein 1-like isoform X1 n=1 Tax=Alosa sapidissima TaxID=34773 RepID=UPI001C0A20F0|nr:leucine rich adaptor protein 1-like isoform X1 [Alosa sapidissima]
MEEVIHSGTCPELKDLEVKLGMKTPASLLRCMREDYTSDERPLDTDERLSMILPEELFEKMKNLKLQMEQVRSADVRIMRQLLSLHEGMEMLQWLQGDRSTLTSLTGSLTGSQSSLGEAAMVHEPGGESPSCCPNTPPEPAHRTCPSPSGSAHCSTSCEDSIEISNQACSTVSSPSDLTASLHEGGPVDLKGLAAVLQRPNKIDCSKDLFVGTVSSDGSGLAQSGVMKGEVIDSSEGGILSTQEEPELSLGQSEALLGYDTHWCWVESKDDVTFL